MEVEQYWVVDRVEKNVFFLSIPLFVGRGVGLSVCVFVGGF